MRTTPLAFCYHTSFLSNLSKAFMQMIFKLRAGAETAPKREPLWGIASLSKWLHKDTFRR